VAGKIIADIIEAPYDSIRMNVANVTVLTANSSGLTYVPTGNVNINIGGTSANLTMNLLTANGIKFPATAVASADPNTLDDYEEGTWTPVFISGAGAVSGTSPVYSGTYTKIGRLVTINMQLSVNPASDLEIASYAGFSGLPFLSALNQSGCITSEDIDAFATLGFCQTGTGSSNIFLSKSGVSGQTTRLYVSLTYTI